MDQISFNRNLNIYARYIKFVEGLYFDVSSLLESTKLTEKRQNEQMNSFMYKLKWCDQCSQSSDTVGGILIYFFKAYISNHMRSLLWHNSDLFLFVDVVTN